MTADDLRNLLSYNPDTGEFIWITRPSKAVKVGAIAGVIDKKGYRTIGICGKVYKAHRLAWMHTYGYWPKGLIDHINGQKSDNRISNLRDVFFDGNSQNIRKPNKRNKSGYLGVIFFQNKWRASITINSKTRCLGDYNTPEEAHAAYLGAKRLHHATCTI